MIRICILLTILALGWIAVGNEVRAEELEPGDPIASIDSQPVYLGELNLILTGRLKVQDLKSLDMQVKQATAALLVRRHLAMKSLRRRGGDALEAMLQRQINRYADEAKRRGTSLEEIARRRQADETSFRADLAWQFAWSQYLQSTLTDKNLRRYFQQHQQRYAGNRWLVSQIFLELQDADAETIASTQQVLAELGKEIQAASDTAQAFADAARQHSDAGSADQGGQVGWVEKDGDLPRNVMAVIRETTAGNVGGPVRSPLGLHLVYVHRVESGQLAFEELTDQSQLRRDASDALFEALIRSQRDAKIVWLVPALQPPAEIPIIP